MKKIISLADIDVANSPVVRAAFNPEVAEEYAEQYRMKKHNMPDPVIFEVGKSLLIGDGLHRIKAMVMAGLKQHVFEVIEGSKQDCLRYALLSNVGHGIRRSNADKRHSVKLALVEFNGLSDGIIAEYCAVSVSFVGDIRRVMVDTKELEPVEKRKGIDGKERTVNPSLTRVETSKPKEIIEKTDTAPVQDSATVSPAGEEVKDETGIIVPDKARPIWERRHQIDPFIDTVEDLKADVEAAKASGDILFKEVNFNSVIADLSNIRGQLLLAKPYAVCFACSGKLPETCKVCLGRGVVSKFRHGLAPAEILEMRSKGG